MRKELDALKSKPSSSSEPFGATTPVEKTATKSKAKPGAKGSVDKKGRNPEPEPADPSEQAKLARLRRLCERKPSGKIHVPEEVHTRWKQATGAERLEMVGELEKADWCKDTGWVILYLSTAVELKHVIYHNGCWFLTM